MKLLKKTFEYLFILQRGKRFAVLFLAALPFGVACAFALDSWQAIRWVSQYAAEGGGFASVWHLGVSPVSAIVRHAIAGVLMVPTLAFLSGYISRNLRTGVFRPQWLFKSMNDSFFPALSVTVVYVVFYLAARLFATLFILLWGRLDAAWLSGTLSIFSAVFIVALFVWLMQYHIMYLPLMAVNGIHPVRAFGRAFGRLNYPKRILVPAVAIPIAVKLAVALVLPLVGIAWLSYLLDALFTTVLVVYLTALSFVAYYDSESLERADYTREYYYRKVK